MQIDSHQSLAKERWTNRYESQSVFAVQLNEMRNLYLIFLFVFLYCTKKFLMEAQHPPIHPPTKSRNSQPHLFVFHLKPSISFKVIIIFFRLPPEFLLVLGPTVWWCASKLCAALLCSSNLGLVSIWVEGFICEQTEQHVEHI